jgi:hypothetical protein
MRRSYLMSAVSVASLALSLVSPAYAADPASAPAVSSSNFKLEAGGGTIAKKSIGFVEGSWAVPLSHSVGLQVDGVAGEWSSKNFEGVAAHLFWRDPAKGLIGLYGDYLNSGSARKTTVDLSTGLTTTINGAYASRGGFEAEAYVDRLSLEARAGWEGGTIGHHFFDRADIAYYPTDDLKLAIGHRMTGNQGAAAFNVEYKLPVQAHGLSLFAAVVTSHNVTSAYGGLRIAFGAGDKSLIRRDREDDPSSDLPQDLFGISNGAQHATTATCHFEGVVVPCGRPT